MQTAVLLLLQRARRAWEWVSADVRRESVRYWLTAVVVLCASVWASPYINASLNLDPLRLGIFQRLTELLGGHYLQPKFSQLVLIGDDDFWDGDLAHRLPTNRAWLATLLDKLDKDGATVIALDFDMRLPHENMAGRPGDYHELDKDYRDETEALIKEIDKVARGHKIVLTKTLIGVPGNYHLAPDVFQPYGICTERKADGSWENPGTKDFFIDQNNTAKNIFCGHIALPYDVLRLPLMVDLTNAGKLDSFALAVARAWSPKVAADIASGDYYGSFMPPETVNEFAPPVSTHDIMADAPKAVAAVAGKIVIVGAGYHRSAFGDVDGGRADSHRTPVGPIVGAELHDNFVEAVLSGRVSSALSPRILDMLEIVFGILAALVFAFFKRVSVKLAVLGGLFVFLLLMQFIMMAVFYTYFEALVPLVGLAVHSIVARVLEA
jgi:CHASE2 domain-containing sensor protein